MRPTGRLHLGNLVGALQNWVKLQEEYDSFHFVADWHMLTTEYADTSELKENTWQMVADWLAAGLDPTKATFFIQSRLPEHAELHLLFSMVTPLSWLERVPTYKEQLENIKDRDLHTYGFLGYPLLQAADILMYKPRYVPVGEDQVPHVELTREVARRFNDAFGTLMLADLPDAAWSGLATKVGMPHEILVQLLPDSPRTAKDKRRVIQEHFCSVPLDVRANYLNSGEGLLKVKPVFPEPEALLTSAPRLPGTDGRKMSKSYDNAIFLTDAPEVVSKKLAAIHDGPGAQASQRPRQSRRLPGVRPAQDLFRSGDDRSCESRMPHGGNRLRGLQEACGRAPERVSRADSGAAETLRARIRRKSGMCSRREPRKPAPWRRLPWPKYAPR